MNKDNVLSFNRSSERVSFHSPAFEQHPSVVEYDIFRSKGMVLIVALLLSLGLWAMIWLAVASIVSRIVA
jgi:hypothetical protein